MHVFYRAEQKSSVYVTGFYPESVYGVLFSSILCLSVYYSCTFLLSRTMIFYSSVTKSSSSASSVSITSSVNAVSSFSKLSIYCICAYCLSVFHFCILSFCALFSFKFLCQHRFCSGILYLTLRHDTFFIPVPAGICLPIITFSFRPTR